MTPDERFERELATVVRDGAPGAAPVALRRRLQASMATNATSVRWRWRARSFAAAIGVVGLLVAVAIGAPLLAPRSPGATQTAGGPPTASMRSPAATESPNGTVPPLEETIVDPGQVQVGQLFTASDGWVVNTNNRLLLTHSGGLAWRDVTPPGIGPNAKLNPSFIDPLDGWVGEFDDPDTADMAVWRTTDAGVTWSRTVMTNVRTESWGLVFLTSTVGWLATDPGGQDPKPQLRWTEDGGASWSDPIDLAVTAGVPVLPELAFADRDHGVLAAAGTVRATGDGGRTWSDVLLPDLPNVAKGSRYLLNAGPPTFVDASHGFLVVNIPAPDSSVQSRYVYATATAGADWRLVLRDDLRRDWAFVDALDWIGLSDGQVWTTHDGGVNFLVQDTSGLPNPFQGGWTAFVDLRNGWGAMVEGAPCTKGGFGCPIRGPGLFATSDGGQIWRRIGDCIFACESPKPS